MLRQTAWLLTLATIAFNGAAAWPDPLGVGMHAVIPVLFVVSVEAARHAIGRIADITADKHMEGVRLTRWLLSPLPTFLLWRRMKLWELRSYDQVIRLEQDRLVYQARLRSRFGRAWRRKAPVESLMPLRLARYGVPLAETAPAGLAAAGIEPAVIPAAVASATPSAPSALATPSVPSVPSVSSAPSAPSALSGPSIPTGSSVPAGPSGPSGPSGASGPGTAPALAREPERRLEAPRGNGAPAPSDRRGAPRHHPDDHRDGHPDDRSRQHAQPHPDGHRPGPEDGFGEPDGYGPDGSPWFKSSPQRPYEGGYDPAFEPDEDPWSDGGWPEDPWLEDPARWDDPDRVRPGYAVPEPPRPGFHVPAGPVQTRPLGHGTVPAPARTREAAPAQDPVRVAGPDPAPEAGPGHRADGGAPDHPVDLARAAGEAAGSGPGAPGDAPRFPDGMSREDAYYQVFRSATKEQGGMPTPAGFGADLQATYGAEESDAALKRYVKSFGERLNAELTEEHIA